MGADPRKFLKNYQKFNSNLSFCTTTNLGQVSKGAVDPKKGAVVFTRARFTVTLCEMPFEET